MSDDLTTAIRDLAVWAAMLSDKATTREEAERIFDRWYAETVRTAKEQAWDEGFETAWRLGTVGDVDPTPNPYQEEP